MRRLKTAVAALLFTAALTMVPANAKADWVTTNAGVKYETNSGYLTGWQEIKSGDTTNKYYFDKNGVMSVGITQIGEKKYFFNEKGQLQFGWITYDGKRYYANTASGVLYQSRWVNNYYFQADCSLAVSKYVDGKWVGANGKYTATTSAKSGWVTSGTKKYYYVNGKKVTGFYTISGYKYYFDSNGVMKTGWITSGGYKYYARSTGKLYTSSWVAGVRFFESSGRMAVGWKTYGTSKYYFNSKGYAANGWTTLNNKLYHFTKGKLSVNKWITTSGKKYYVNGTGQKVKGLKKVGSYYYYLSSSDGHMLKGWINVGNKTYYADAYGRLYRSKWFTKDGRRYYAQANGTMAKGLVKVGTKVYYFHKTKGYVLANMIRAVGTDKYYTGTDGAVLINTWKQIKGYYYYFGADGKMVKNSIVDGYVIDAYGRRSGQAKQGWVTVDGKKYYYENNVKTTGFKTISGKRYHFDETTGAMSTGLVKVGKYTYYFGTDGVKQVSKTVTVGNYKYTLASNGVVIKKESTIDVSGNNKGAQIAKYGVQFVGNRYVYGGNSLTNGVDCSGFTQQVLLHFGISIPRTADEQMKSSRGTAVSTSSMLPGDLVFYGSGGYASHVAIYIGNGQIVHASNSQPYPQGGIKISNYDYRTPLKIVRYWA